MIDVEQFIAKWQASGGNERANTQLFVTDLTHLLGVEPPHPTVSDTTRNDYVFERHVIKTEIDGATSNGWIDCYKRDCFILEAKQGSAADIAAVEGGAGGTRRDFFGQTAAERFKRGMAKRGTGQWTGAMQRAAAQAEGYAKNLPADHGWPPFLLVADIGWCIDVYADFARSGKGYAPFPDRRRYRITLDQLRDADVRARLAAIWTAPMALDPAAEAARVTRGIAAHLATLARDIEAREHNPDRVAAFLMRLLFTMFAEDTGLIARDSFSELLKAHRDSPDGLGRQLSELWRAMDEGDYALSIGRDVIRFNGWLFKDRTAIPLIPTEVDLLIAAAAADWRQVEPAIFGTLLERALDVRERAKLGAHYTPRAYVERLVGPTIMEPLRADWEGARTAATIAAEAGDRETARAEVERFHLKLAATRVLDPACGTGNFLYVAMARMKELEGEVLELLDALGDERYLSELGSHTITPENFLGIEINPRAAAIAQLVLWIGYLQWHFRVNGEDRMPEAPVLRDVKSIENRDALISWDRRELERDQHGRPVTRWDGETTKPHPVTGKPVPDETAQVEVYRYVNPKPAKWPKADFIIGNPPFIGSKRMRTVLGDTYVDALQEVQPAVPDATDLVLRWWHNAARLVEGGAIRRFGLVGTNSITQSYNRRIIEIHLKSKSAPLSLLFAVADHPWVDERDGAAVRISMSVVAAGSHSGTLIRHIAAADETSSFSQYGRISADFRVGVDVTAACPLRSNDSLCCVGMKTIGEGFILTQAERGRFELLEGSSLSNVVRPYLNGRDLSQRSRNVFVIDFFGHEEAWVQVKYPALYNYLLTNTKPEREQNRNKQFSSVWWVIGHPRPLFRRFTKGLNRYIVTLETSKHRFFTFLPVKTVPDSALVTFGLDDALCLGVLSSHIHFVWTWTTSATLGVATREQGHRYNKTQCFDPFPFPDTTDEPLKARIRDAAERLDALRKEVLARHEDLTLTKLYNALESLRAAEKAGTVLGPRDRDVAERGCVSLIRQYHDAIDRDVAAAYGWPADLSDEDVLERLVALNAERAREEAQGKVRWLRPDFQAPGHKPAATQVAMPLPEAPRAAAAPIVWPGALPEQVVAVAGIVERSGRPVAPGDVARAFKGKRAATVLPVLDALAGMGRVRKLEDGRYAA